MYLQFTVHCPAAWSETIGTLLVECGCTGTSEKVPLTRAEGRRQVVGYADLLRGGAEELTASVRARLDTLAREANDPALAGLEARVTTLEEQPWEDLWKERWRPFRVARFILRPPWREARPRPGDLEVVLDPGSAFGTGLHVTTRMTLRELARWLDTLAVDPATLAILDAGTGSGILTVAALKAGVGRVDAFDIDERSVRTAGRNLQENGVAHRARIWAGGAATVRGSYPLVLANLETDPHLDNAADLAGRVAPEGTLVGCGIHRARVEEVLAAYGAAGLSGGLVAARGKWCAVRLRRRLAT